MGVRGLSSFMNDHGLFEEISLENKGRIIIDGNNLRFFLVEKRVNTHYGMDYDKYAQFVRTWFSRLIALGNSIILVFDGVGEENKEKTSIARKKDQIRSSVSVSPTASRAHISILSKDIFVAIAKSFPSSEILVLQTNYECDNIMANLARKLKAPVLTNDSDFYIFNVEFLPLNYFDLESLKCSRFNKQGFMKKFNILNESCIYLLASLLGNDYIPMKLLEHFYSQVHFPFKTKKMSPSTKRIFALLLWLGRCTSTEEALETVISKFPMNKRTKLVGLIRESMRVYNGENNIESSIQSLESKEDIRNFIKDVDKPLKDPQGNSPSDYFLELFTELKVDAWLGNIFANRVLSIPIPVEEKMEETGFLFCLPIYKLIIEFMSPTEDASIKCLTRNKASLQIMYIKVEKPLHQTLSGHESKMSILLQAVGLSSAQYEALREHFNPSSHILFLALYYYSSRRTGSSLYIKSLIVLLLTKAPLVTGESGPPNGMNDNFTSRMKAFYVDTFKSSNAQTPSHFSRFIVHEFSLLQTCIHAVFSLNTLLKHPLSPMTPPLHEFWNCTFLYNFTNDILGYIDRDARYNYLLTLRVDKTQDQPVLRASDRIMTRLESVLPSFNPRLGVSSTGKRPRNRKKNSNPEE